MAQGGTMTAVMNAANEAAVVLFLDHKIPFPGITRRVEQAMARHTPVAPTLDNVLAADTWARETVASRN